MPYNEEQSVNAIKALLKTIHRLRAPGGCPWDREQTHASLRQYLIEETYETIEVLDQIKSPEDLQKPALKKAFIEEWGDVLLQILLNAEVASEHDSTISIASIADSLNEKMIRRHPHVFGEVKAENSGEVLKNWEQIKKTEKATQTGAGSPGQEATSSEAAPLPSILDSVHPSLPALPRTMKLISKVTKVGFQWPDLKGPVEKLEEEVRELKEELAGDLKSEEQRQKIQSELGDVLFNVCNISHFLKLDPEEALRTTIRKFDSRFRHIEKRLHEKGSSLEKSDLAEMDLYWDEAKKLERS